MRDDARHLTAQQTNLVRAVLASDPRYLIHSHGRDPQTGQKTVMPLVPEELKRFRIGWKRAPVRCIRAMNHAIAAVEKPERSTRYTHAAFDLEILMDRSSRETGADFVGVPTYLSDGYTDLGFFPARSRRERILVDKERLARHLVPCKREVVEGLQGARSSAALEALIRNHARTLRVNVGYTEVAGRSRRSDETIYLSDSVENRTVAARHLSILLQLRFQEAGINSRLVKGVLRLYGLKGRHAWNVVVQDGISVLVDVTYGEEDGPLVLAGPSLAELYQRASAQNRFYCPSPESFHHYQIRRC